MICVLLSANEKTVCLRFVSDDREGRQPVFFITCLALADSVVGADGCAAAAADACIRIDVIDFALGDSLYGANGLAGATCDAVVAYYVCHSC